MKNPTLRVKTRILFLFALLCAAIASVQSVHAAIFNPNDVAALITAMTTSNANGEDDTIELATNGTYTLTAINNGTQNGLPEIKDPGHKLVIHGNGATLQRSTAVGTPAFRIFDIDFDADVTIDGLTIMNGGSSVSGAGIQNRGTLTITNSTISGNSGSSGGGISNNHGTVTVTNSTVSGNSAAVGGGIFNDRGTLAIINSTISGNSADNGGGINNDGEDSGNAATLTITNSTFSGNSASFGGGIRNTGQHSGSATLTIGDTILNAGSGENILNQDGTVTSLGYNLSSDATGPNDGSTDLLNTDPMLEDLADNGGPTFTHALKNESPAIDAGKNLSGSANDQRGPGFDRTVDLGQPRPTGGDGTDIGAFELQQFTGEADLLIGIGVDKTTVKQGDLLTYTITVQNFGPDTAINAVVNDVLANGSTFVSAHANKGSFTRPPVGQTGTVTWYLGDILSSGQESAQIVVTVIVRGKTTITNTGNVSSLSDDPNTANNTASIAVSVASGKGGGGGGGHGHH